MECYEVITKIAIFLVCVTISKSFVIVKSDESDDSKSIENRISYLIDLLQQFKQIAEPDYDSDDISNDVTSLTDFIEKAGSKSDDKSRGIVQPVDDTYARLIDIHKKDFAILPPANEWCRMMGFRRCRQSHS